MYATIKGYEAGKAHVQLGKCNRKFPTVTSTTTATEHKWDMAGGR